MGKKYSLNYLSHDFYKKYNFADYPEIENKVERPYMVLLVEIDNNTFAIPFRTNVKHPACYKFKSSSRNTRSSTGLDYSKAVIVNDSKYIGNAATIDNKEYLELNSKFYFIIKQFKSYVDGYKKFLVGELNDYEGRKYKFSTLQYFHKEMGIEIDNSSVIDDRKEQNVVPENTERSKDAVQDKAYISRETLKKSAKELAEKRSKAPTLSVPSKKHDNSLE